MSSPQDRAKARCASIAESIGRRGPEDADLAAIEACDQDGGRREDDLALLREALSAGLEPSAMSELVAVVVTDFTFDVNWEDQFRYWPILAQHLRWDRLVTADHLARRAVAAAFEAFSTRWRGVAPAGALRREFPLMSWPLVHSVMPWCAQRHLARVLERAAEEGLLPEEGERWPEGEVESLAARMGVPIFVSGLVANPAVLARLGRVLLGEVHADAPLWISRVRRRVEADAVSRSLVEVAQRTRAEGRSGRAQRARPLPVTLGLRRVPEGLAAWVELGPYEESVAALPEVQRFARDGAALVARVGEKDAASAPLFNALSAPAQLDLRWESDPLRVRPAARPYEGVEVPAVLKKAEVGAERVFALPLCFRQESEGRFALSDGAVVSGDSCLVLAPRGAELSGLLAAGFTVAEGKTPAGGVALFGVASRASSPAMSALGFKVRERAASLVPALLPPTRSRGEQLFIPLSRDVWLRVADADTPITAATLSPEPEEPHARAELLFEEGGSAMVRVPAAALAEPRVLRVFGRSQARPLAELRLVGEPPRPRRTLNRWRAELRPAGATLRHLLAGQCWVHAEHLPGIRVELELELGGRSIAVAVNAGELGPFASAARLRAAAEVLTQGEVAPERAELRARSREDEAWSTVATLEAGEGGLHFELSPRPSVVAPDEAASLHRLSFGREGCALSPCAPSELVTEGVYVARAGEVLAALCVAQGRAAPPAFDALSSARRSRARGEELLALLRAVDVAPLYGDRGRARLLRHAAARALERELVAGLCGAEWLRQVEPAVAEVRRDEVARALWMGEQGLRALVEEHAADPVALLRSVLEALGLERGFARAEHLLLTFYSRGMTSPSRDSDAVRWAWEDAARARAARACYLLASDPFAKGGSADDEP